MAWGVSPRARDGGGRGCRALRGGEMETLLMLTVMLSWGVCLRVCTHSVSPALCDPVDCSPPGPSVHGILQAQTLEWGAMPSSRGSS